MRRLLRGNGEFGFVFVEVRDYFYGTWELSGKGE